MVADRAKLVDDFGVRLIRDLEGLPVIMSFYQWGSSYRGTDRNAVSMERDHAMEQARLQADRQIAEYLSANAEYDVNSDVGREIEVAAARHADGYDERRPSTTSVTDAMLRAMKRRAQVTALTGLSTLARWTGRHPVTNQMIFGAVRTWSAAVERDVRAYRDQPPRRARRVRHRPGAGAHAGPTGHPQRPGGDECRRFLTRPWARSPRRGVVPSPPACCCSPRWPAPRQPRRSRSVCRAKARAQRGRKP